MLSRVGRGRGSFEKQVLCNAYSTSARVPGVKYLKLYWKTSPLLYGIHLPKCGHPQPSGLGSFVGDGDKDTFRMLCFTLKSLRKLNHISCAEEVSVLPMDSKWSWGDQLRAGI